jgi:hypothetical protein
MHGEKDRFSSRGGKAPWIRTTYQAVNKERCSLSPRRAREPKGWDNARARSIVYCSAQLSSGSHPMRCTCFDSSCICTYVPSRKSSVNRKTAQVTRQRGFFASSSFLGSAVQQRLLPIAWHMVQMPLLFNGC